MTAVSSYKEVMERILSKFGFTSAENYFADILQLYYGGYIRIDPYAKLLDDITKWIRKKNT